MTHDDLPPPARGVNLSPGGAGAGCVQAGLGVPLVLFGGLFVVQTFVAAIRAFLTQGAEAFESDIVTGAHIPLLFGGVFVAMGLMMILPLFRSKKEADREP